MIAPLRVLLITWKVRGISLKKWEQRSQQG